MFWQLCFQAARARRRMWLAFSAAGAGFLWLYLSVYPTVQQQAVDYNKILEHLPKGVVAAFNISQTATTLMGFLASKHFGLVWALMLIMLTISYGGFVVAREVEAKTMGLLLAQPISRAQLYASRWLTGLVGLAGFVVLSELIVWPLAHAYNYAISGREVLLIGLLGWLFGFAVLGLAMLVSAWASEGSTVTGGAGGLILVMYVAYLISSLEPNLDKLKYVSLFHYFSPGSVITDGHLSLSSVVVLFAVGLVAGAAGWLVFERRDISV